jgi:hypothetical protein
MKPYIMARKELDTERRRVAEVGGVVGLCVWVGGGLMRCT